MKNAFHNVLPKRFWPQSRKGLNDQAIANAIENDEIKFFVQPIWDIKLQSIAGFEALIRWKKINANVILPKEFLRPFNAYVISHKSSRLRMKLFNDVFMSLQTYPDQFISFNIDLDFLGMPEIVNSFLNDLGPILNTRKEMPVLEISERALAIKVDSALIDAQFHKLRALGVKFALDDFGVKESNFERLSRFDVDMVKLDKALIKDIDRNTKFQKIVRSIVRLADDLGIVVIAEGMEKSEHACIMRDLGVRFQQGFIHSRPIAADKISDKLPQIGCNKTCLISYDCPIKLPSVVG